MTFPRLLLMRKSRGASALCWRPGHRHNTLTPVDAGDPTVQRHRGTARPTACSSQTSCTGGHRVPSSPHNTPPGDCFRAAASRIVSVTVPPLHNLPRSPRDRLPQGRRSDTPCLSPAVTHPLPSTENERCHVYDSVRPVELPPLPGSPAHGRPVFSVCPSGAECRVGTA